MTPAQPPCPEGKVKPGRSLPRLGGEIKDPSYFSDTNLGSVFFFQEVDTLDISSIRDTRIGRYARLPKVRDKISY